MENSNMIQSQEAQTLHSDTVCVPRTRYDELVRAEMEREILFHVYQTMPEHTIDYIMDAIFNPKFKFKAANRLKMDAE